jgi:hypothetical protein
MFQTAAGAIVSNIASFIGAKAFATGKSRFSPENPQVFLSGFDKSGEEGEKPYRQVSGFAICQKPYSP